MKKIGKIQIKLEKVMNNDELLHLRGGYETPCCKCTNGYTMYGATTKAECEDFCNDLPGQHGVWSC